MAAIFSLSLSPPLPPRLHLPYVNSEAYSLLRHGYLRWNSASCKPKSKRQLLNKSFNSPPPSTPSYGSLETEEAEDEEEQEFAVLTSATTKYNDIKILDSSDSRLLILDSSYNIHSMLPKGSKWTGAYWDEFASLPAILPPGPIAILGLGGGTAAHLMLQIWPSLELHGWEIDEILIDKAREYFDLSDLETKNEAGGILHVHIGDALSPEAVVPGGFAGIVVDLFSDAKVLRQLDRVTAWLDLKGKLKPGGRIMVNCSGVLVLAQTCIDKKNCNHIFHVNGDSGYNPTTEAICAAFCENVNCKISEGEGLNFLALTGPLPDLDEWSHTVPEQLKSSVKQWWPCGSSR